MHLHTSDGNIKKYNSIDDILTDYYVYRKEMYNKRKEYHIRYLENEINIIKWKIKFLEYVLSKKIRIMKNGKGIEEEEIIQRLVELKFPKLAQKLTITHNNDDNNDDNNDNDDNDDNDANKLTTSYKYITNIKMFSLTPKQLDKLRKDKANRRRAGKDLCHFSRAR